MHRRIVAAAMAGVLSLSAAGSLHAAPFGRLRNSPQGKANASKMITFNVRNDSKVSLVLQAGDQQLSIAPGQTTKVKLAEGVTITTVSATASRAAGTVLATVARQLEGNTLAVS